MLRRLWLAWMWVATGAFADEISGRWYSVSRSRGGLGTMLDFRSDGSVEYSPGAIVDYRWRIHGANLALTSIDPVKGEENMDTFFRISGNALTIGNPSGVQLTFSRQGNGTGLAGIWTAQTMMDGHPVRNTWHFRDDGSALFTVEFTTKPGRYSAANGRFRMSIQGVPAMDGTFRFDQGELVLPGSRGENRFRRF